MKLQSRLSVIAGAALLSASFSSLAADRALIQNKGSDTLVNVAQAWAEHYKDVNAGVAVAVSGGGSGTGIAALINGTASHTIEFDDIFRDGLYHPGSPVIAASGAP